MAPPAAHEMQQLKNTLRPSKRLCYVWLHVLLLFALFGLSKSQSIVDTLPGFSGDLPFKLETGYVSVGELNDVELFYYFIESERDPARDPLILWLTGGPGCSGFSGLVYEIGPLRFNYTAFNGSRPSLELNPYSWTKVASIIFLDAPVGTGFSYATNADDYYASDTISAWDNYIFIRKWLIDHPRFLYNQLYIGGDSYSGIIVPILTLEIANGIQMGLKPPMTLMGYILGNPVTHLHDDENSRIPYAHRMALISDELYESAKNACKGEFIDTDESNGECMETMAVITKCTEKLNSAQILEPVCALDSPKPKESKLKWSLNHIEDVSSDMISLPVPQRSEFWCRNYNYLLSYIWENDNAVQEALHVRNGTISFWKRCNKTLDYDSNVESTVPYHRNLSYLGYRALIYSGDHDMLIPYVGTERWVKSLNIPVLTGWEPWFVDGQVAGYSVIYQANKTDTAITYATVKGGGHTAPEFRPKQCLAMIDRWLAFYPL
ncbi:hypothetical protein PVL29_003371 [Vitis rotundifolia]|uniref:Serine carboxypeptidase-like 18 n=3 Tax=Vitis rotundifolia TaxID=103349 RepID=A0AA39ACW1_VITRO|nr:hypothetical protein PVL29_003371 [Vitis rotundifolia]